MFRQIKYFQAIVRTGSFSTAADECAISQSAISQQLMALEHQLGFKLLERSRRQFYLTPAGEFFYRQSLKFSAEWESIIRDARKISRGEVFGLKFGILKSLCSQALHLSLSEFCKRYAGADMHLELSFGDHEELFDLLRNDDIDVLLSDQRRAFSEEYVNFPLCALPLSIEVSVNSPLADFVSLGVEDLKNFVCIIVASKEYRDNEEEYYRTVLGFKSNFIFAQSMESARLMVSGNQGFLPVDECMQSTAFPYFSRVKLIRGNDLILRRYCLFWKKNRPLSEYEILAQILKRHFEQSKKS